MQVLSLASSLQGYVLPIVFHHCYNSNGKWGKGLLVQNMSRCQTFSYRLPCSSPCSREVLFEHSFAQRMERGKKTRGRQEKGLPGLCATLLAIWDRNTFVLQVTPAGFIPVHQPPSGVPEKPNAFVQDPTAKNISRDLSASGDPSQVQGWAVALVALCRGAACLPWASSSSHQVSPSSGKV